MAFTELTTFFCDLTPDGVVFAGPENYFLRGYVPTRMALWFLIDVSSATCDKLATGRSNLSSERRQYEKSEAAHAPLGTRGSHPTGEDRMGSTMALRNIYYHLK